MGRPGTSIGMSDASDANVNLRPLSRFRDEEENPDLALPSAFTNSLLYAAGRLDLACGGFLPFGSSVFCIGEK